jgi:hypothetical protein
MSKRGILFEVEESEMLLILEDFHEEKKEHEECEGLSLYRDRE